MIMQEVYRSKFFNLFMLVPCLDDKVLKKTEKIERVVVTPEEKLDMWLSDKNFKGEAQDLIKIGKYLMKKDTRKITVEKKEEKSKKDILYDMIPEENKKRYDPFDIFKLMYGIEE